MIIGIDAGGSAIKFAGMEGEDIVFTRYVENKRMAASAAVNTVLDEYGKSVRELRLTGVNARKCGLENLGIPYSAIHEPEAIGRGGVFLSGESEAIVASLGTGTAFVLAKNGVFTHLGGTGVGGGTLSGLGERVLGLSDAVEIDALAAGGNMRKVDITIGDLFSGSDTLMPELTASNLAKRDSGATGADWATGLINLVLQAVGTMSTLSAKGHGVNSVVFTGALSALSAAPGIFRRFEECYGLKYAVARSAECATAVGAAISGRAYGIN